MHVEGPNLGNYQPQHIQVVRRETAQSVKPDVFKNLEDPDVMARLLKDEVALSPEARNLLKQLKNGKLSLKDLQDAKADKLIYTLKDIRRQLEEEEKKKDDEDAGGKKSKGLMHTLHPQQYPLPLSGPENNKERRPQPSVSAAGELLDRMIVISPSQEARRRLIADLEVMGERVIEDVRKHNARIIILEKGQPMSSIKIAGMYLIGRGEKTFDGRDWDTVPGLYDNGRKLLVVREDFIGRSSHSTPRHELAHAWDHAMTDKGHRRLPISVDLWYRFSETRKSLITPYAGTNPQEYFAECMEAWFQPNLKDKLPQCDPQMYQYLQSLFAA